MLDNDNERLINLLTDFGFLFDIDESFSSPCFRPSNLWSVRLFYVPE